MNEEIASQLLDLIKKLTNQFKQQNAELIATRTALLALLALLSLQPNQSDIFETYELLMAPAREDDTLVHYLPQAEGLIRKALM